MMSESPVQSAVWSASESLAGSSGHAEPHTTSTTISTNEQSQGHPSQVQQSMSQLSLSREASHPGPNSTNTNSRPIHSPSVSPAVACNDYVSRFSGQSTPPISAPYQASSVPPPAAVSRQQPSPMATANLPVSYSTPAYTASHSMAHPQPSHTMQQLQLPPQQPALPQPTSMPYYPSLPPTPTAPACSTPTPQLQYTTTHASANAFTASPAQPMLPEPMLQQNRYPSNVHTQSTYPNTAYSQSTYAPNMNTYPSQTPPLPWHSTIQQTYTIQNNSPSTTGIQVTAPPSAAAPMAMAQPLQGAYQQSTFAPTFTPLMTSQTYGSPGQVQSTTNASPYTTQATAGGPDVWKHLQSVRIPTFDGDKRAYATWKAAFTVCVHNQPISAELKLLQLRQCLAGAPLKTIESFGYSAAAYQAAMSRLEAKFGGTKRQVAVHLEALDKFQPIRAGRGRELEKFADLLQVAVINLKDTGRDVELQAGTFYTRLLQKLNPQLLAQYNRWVYERAASESVETLLEWTTREAEFMVNAAETLDGVVPTTTYPNTAPARQTVRAPTHTTHERQHRTHVTSDATLQCPECQGNHGLSKCAAFQQLTVDQRWLKAKQFRICFRCLSSGHQGTDCERSRICGIDNCARSHHRLLHINNQP